MTQPIYKRDTPDLHIPDGRLLAKAKAYRQHQLKLIREANLDNTPKGK